MMAVFGVEEWCERGEVFSVYFGMFSRLGIFGGRGRPARRGAGRSPRRPRWATVPGSAAVVIASIATTSFDGAQEGAFKGAIESTFDWLVDAGIEPDHRAAPHRHDLHRCSASPASPSSTCSACAGCGPSAAPPRSRSCASASPTP